MIESFVHAANCCNIECEQRELEFSLAGGQSRVERMKGQCMSTEDDPTDASIGTVGAVVPVVCDDSDAVLLELDKNLEDQIQAFRESERLSEEDFAIRINVRD